MSVVTELMYNTLNTIKEECQEHQEHDGNCFQCPFYNSNVLLPCKFSEPDTWDIDSMVDKIYENKHFRGR